jgi:hypothetical protein
MNNSQKNPDAAGTVSGHSGKTNHAHKYTRLKKGTQAYKLFGLLFTNPAGIDIIDLEQKHGVNSSKVAKHYLINTHGVNVQCTRKTAKDSLGNSLERAGHYWLDQENIMVDDFGGYAK